MTKFCIILANARSGTLALGAGVERMFDTKWAGEIFHENQADPSFDFDDEHDPDQPLSMLPHLNYFNFRHDQLKKNSELCYPSEKNQNTLFDMYISHVNKFIKKPAVILDIKYSSWHHFNSYWMMPGHRPALSNFVQNSGFEVVHVLRQNLFSQYCSMIIALQSGVWHLRENESHPTKKIEIDLDDCSSRLTALDLASKWYQSIFADYAHCHTINYEQIFEGNSLSQGVVDTFSHVLEQEPTGENVTSIRKTSPPLRDVVKNRDDVLKHFQTGPFAAMVQEALDG